MSSEANAKARWAAMQPYAPCHAMRSPALQSIGMFDEPLPHSECLVMTEVRTCMLVRVVLCTVVLTMGAALCRGQR